MLDTNICIQAIKHRPEQLLRNLQEHEPSEICLSSVSYAELAFGVEKSARKDWNRLALTMLLSNIDICVFDTSAAESYARVRAELEGRGTPIGPLDTMIAGHALSEDCCLVTNNTKEFRRVKDLRVEDWTK